MLFLFPASVEEKAALYRAYRKINPQYLNATNAEIDKDITSNRNRSLKDSGLTMKFTMANCPIYGQDVEINWVLENVGSEIKDRKFNLIAQGMMYNGCVFDQLWKENIHVTLGPGEGNMGLLHKFINCLYKLSFMLFPKDSKTYEMWLIRQVYRKKPVNIISLHMPAMLILYLWLSFHR